MNNVITIKTKKTEIGLGGDTGWYLLTTIGRYRIERYRDLDGRVVWARFDTVKERAEREQYLRSLMEDGAEEFAVEHGSDDELGGADLATNHTQEPPLAGLYAPA